MHVFYVKNNGTVARMGATLYKDTIAVFGKIWHISTEISKYLKSSQQTNKTNTSTGYNLLY